VQYDVVDLIMQDHREVERLFDELKNHPEKRPLLTPVMCGLLVAHSRAEESEVYPGMMIEYCVRPLFGFQVTWLTEITS